MTIQKGKNFYTVGTKAQQPWMDREIAVFKRVGPFTWEPLDMHFDTVEDAWDYINFIDLLEAA
jgi:hypothetical protein